MLTLLTGILGSNYDSCLQASSANFLREQARLIAEYASHPWVWLSVQRTLNEAGSKFLWAASCSKDDETTISEVKDILESNQALILETLERRLEPLEKRLESMENIDKKFDVLQALLLKSLSSQPASTKNAPSDAAAPLLAQPADLHKSKTS